MIDIHCHILPGVDDGADQMQTAILMAAMAADDGIEAVIATPHVTWRNGVSPQRMGELQEAGRRFQSAVAQSGIPLTCFLGAEVLCEYMGETAPDRQSFPCLAGTAYALVEFLFDEPAQVMTDWLRRLREAGIRPIVAHPERYQAVQKNKKLPAQWVEEGVALQINKGSPMGVYGRAAKKTAERILQQKLAALMATDAHGIRGRTLCMARERALLEQEYGRDYLRVLTVENPMRLLQGEELL